MKVIVDELPKEPKECLFSKWDKAAFCGYICPFKGDYCWEVDECPFLKQECEE